MPLPMAHPAQRVRHEGEHGEQQQSADEQALVLRNPNPMAVPKLARAGKQAAQPIAETTLPSAPVLSAMRVIKPMMSLPIQRLTA